MIFRCAQKTYQIFSLNVPVHSPLLSSPPPYFIRAHVSLNYKSLISGCLKEVNIICSELRSRKIVWVN